nr:MAG TPA: hypothetical protein [Caudoviricetes sp.]
MYFCIYYAKIQQLALWKFLEHILNPLAHLFVLS